VWETVDPDGLPVILEWHRWRHVRESHPDLKTTPEQLLGIVSAPVERIRGRKPRESWFYGRGGPSVWIRVVVHYDDERGRIITAFSRRSIP